MCICVMDIFVGIQGANVGMEMPWSICGSQETTKTTLNIGPPHLPCLRQLLLFFCYTSS